MDGHIYHLTARRPRPSTPHLPGRAEAGRFEGRVMRWFAYE